MQFKSVTFIGYVLLQLLTVCLCDWRTHKYEKSEPVTLWVNKVGPFNNPQETYPFYVVPFCKSDPDSPEVSRPSTVGDSLLGNNLIDSKIAISFKDDIQKSTICQIKVSEDVKLLFEYQIRQQYWQEQYMDGLPIWSFIGNVSSSDQPQLFTHSKFTIQYNEDQIVGVNMNSSELKDLVEGTVMPLTYEVTWVPVDTPFTQRFDKYLDNSFFEHQIHWFSIINAFMMVVVLVAVVIVILLRTLRKDFARYAQMEDELDSLERDVSEEYGWKLVHGDVFRAPERLDLLSACIGTGAQFVVLTLTVLVMSVRIKVFQERGAMLTIGVVGYVLSTLLSGYISGWFYANNAGKDWMYAMILTATAFPGLLFAVSFTLSLTAFFYTSFFYIQFVSVSLRSILFLVLLFVMVPLPLSVIGFVVGKNAAKTGALYPCRVKRIPSPIPPAPWYLTPAAIALLSGLLPFGSIFIEMYFVFTSFWNYKVYYMYEFLLLVFIVLLIVSVCVSIVGTYTLLSAENYHWWWTAVGSSASTGLYILLYSVYFYVFRTQMSGWMQCLFYFGYTFLLCAGIAVMLGAVGFAGSYMFVVIIYKSVKVD